MIINKFNDTNLTNKSSQDQNQDDHPRKFFRTQNPNEIQNAFKFNKEAGTQSIASMVGPIDHIDLAIQASDNEQKEINANFDACSPIRTETLGFKQNNSDGKQSTCLQARTDSHLNRNKENQAKEMKQYEYRNVQG